MRLLAARGGLFLIGFLGSLYALLCSIPFAWVNLIKDAHYPGWVAVVLKAWPFLFAGAGVLAARALEGPRRRLFGGSALVAAGAALLLGLPGSLSNAPSSLAAAFLFLVPHGVWELLLGGGAGSPAADLDDDPGGRAAAWTAAGAFCALTSSAATAAWVERPGAWALVWSLLTHVCLFAGAAFAVDALSRVPSSGKAARLAAVLVLSSVLARWGLASMSFTGPVAWAYALSLSANLVAAVDRGARALPEASTKARAAGLLLCAAVPFALRPALRADWNGLVAELSAVALAAAAARLMPRPAPGRRAWPWAAAVLALCWGADALGGAKVESSVRAFAAADPSLRAARRLLARPAGGIDAFLAENTNLPRGTVKPRSLVPADLGPDVPGPKPHVFVIVVDSLRPDRLGAYAPGVRTTPAIDAFAKEADRFDAFTAYGGTGMSEPSIWAGAMLPHEQYPAPFAPFNALEALVDREGYHPMVTVDVILSQTLKADKAATALDAKTTGNYKLCGTLRELEDRLGEGGGRPLFVYTQPQDVHISVLTREGARYEDRVAAMDACFGRFVAALKAKGLYDKSVLILTADHGDSLGEGGRFGHAYTLYPEIVRVPLIVRLPPALRARFVPDLEAPAFLTDVTPTLYSLLGRPPKSPEEPFGRPLYAATRAELEATRRPARLLASSYGPVYGVLEGKRTFFVADGVKFESHLFDLERPLEDARPDSARQEAGEKDLRARVSALRAFYGY